MPSKHHRQLRDTLAALARKLPRHAELAFNVEEDHVWLHKIYLPKSSRGQGSKLLADVLVATDAAGLPVCLTADPTDDPTDPATIDLVRWYKRFGFVPYSATDDGIIMQREPDGARPSAPAIVAKAVAAKANDLTHEEYEALYVPSTPSKAPSPKF